MPPEFPWVSRGGPQRETADWCIMRTMYMHMLLLWLQMRIRLLEGCNWKQPQYLYCNKSPKKMWAPRVLRATLNEETWHYSRSNRRNCQTSLNFIRPHFLTRVGFCLQRIFSYFSWAKAHCPLLFRKKKKEKKKKTPWNALKCDQVIKCDHLTWITKPCSLDLAP